MAYVNALLNIRRLEDEPPRTLFLIFLRGLKNVPLSFTLQESEWIDLVLQIYEPSVVHWSKDLKPTSID